MKKILSLLCFSLMVITLMAQNGKVTVSGTVWDADLNEAMGQATVQLLSAKDSSFVNGGISQMNGHFQLPAVKAGNYLLKVSFIGYLPEFKTLKLTTSKPKVNVGTISLSADAVMMEEAVVVGQAPPVQMSEDTVVFNSAAYKVAAGSALEELVKKLMDIRDKPEGLENTELVSLQPHFLSCRTADGKKGLLLAVVLDEFLIQTPGRVVHVGKPVLAITSEPSALGEEYGILLNSRLLN